MTYKRKEVIGPHVLMLGDWCLTMRDGATFKLANTIWHREWTGDAYHWTTGKLRVGWCELERVDTGYDEDGEVTCKHVRRWFVELDGKRQSVFYPTTKAAMVAAMRG